MISEWPTRMTSPSASCHSWTGALLTVVPLVEFRSDSSATCPSSGSPDAGARRRCRAAGTVRPGRGRSRWRPRGAGRCGRCRRRVAASPHSRRPRTRAGLPGLAIVVLAGRGGGRAGSHPGHSGHRPAGRTRAGRIRDGRNPAGSPDRGRPAGCSQAPRSAGPDGFEFVVVVALRG